MGGNQLGFWSASVYIVAVPLAFLVSAFIRPIRDLKWCFQYQLLVCIWLAILCVIFASRGAFKAYMSWVFSLNRYRFLFALTLFWLMSMLAIHGSGARNYEGVVSGIVFLFMAPFFVWLFGHFSSRKVLLRLICVGGMCCILTLENIFLLIHSRLGVGLSAEYQDLAYLGVSASFFSEYLPKIFINVRDGNSLAVALCGFSFCMLLRRCGEFRIRRLLDLREVLPWLLHLFSAFMSFSNAYLTQGRGFYFAFAMLSLFAIIFSLLRKIESSVLACIGLVALFWLVGGFAAFVVRTISQGDGAPALYESMLARAAFDLSGYGARWLLWKSYLVQGLSESWFWGAGFNFRPALPEVLPRSLQFSTPHSLFVQIISNAGLAGVVISCFWLSAACRFVWLELESPYEPLLILLPLVGYSFVAGMFATPLGVWLLTIIPLFLQSRRREFFVGSRLVFGGGPVQRLLIVAVGLILIVTYLCIKC